MSSCIREKLPEAVSSRVAAVEMTVSTRAGSDTSTPEATDTDLEIKTLRVYAFYKGDNNTLSVPAGHFKSDNFTGSTIHFEMDMKVFQIASQKMKFYAIANAESLDGVNLSETTTEAELNSITFSSLDTSKGLPMVDSFPTEVFLTPSQTFDHIIVEKQFNLIRPMGKLTVAAAKKDANGKLTIKSVTKVKGFAANNGLFNSSSFSPKTSSEEMTITALSSDGAKQYTGKTSDNRKDLAYFDVVAVPEYLFENPNGKDLKEYDWKEEVSNGGQLAITYDFDGFSQTGYVNLPKVERNKHIVITCLMNNRSEMDITLTVSDWNQAKESWSYSKTVVVNEDGKINWTSGSATTAGIVALPGDDPVTCNFTIASPADATWHATLIPVDGVADALVFKLADGSNATSCSGAVGTEGNITIIKNPYVAAPNGASAKLRIVVKSIAGVSVVTELVPSDASYTEYTIVRNRD